MNFLVRAKRFFDELDERQLSYYFLGGIVLFVLVVFGLFYIHRGRVVKLQREFAIISNYRRRARPLLERYAVVEQRKRQVDEVLERDKDFRIKQYFSQVVAELNLTPYIQREEVLPAYDLRNGYSEIKLVATISGINMQQLVSLVYSIEKNNRLYTKELSMTKSTQTSALDVTLVIATLQSQVGS